MKLVTCASALLIAASAAANPPDRYHYTYRGNGADASFDFSQECGGTYASVWVNENVSLSGGNRTSSQGGSFYFSSYDWCAGENTYGWGDLSGADFDGNGARGASLSYTGEGVIEQFLGCEQILCPCRDEYEQGWCEYEDEGNYYGCYCDWESGQCFRDECNWQYTSVPVEIDLTWTPNGDVYRGMSNSSSRYKDYFYRSRYVGTSASATVQGSFMVGETDMCTEATGSWGSTWSSTNGDMVISHAVR